MYKTYFVCDTLYLKLSFGLACSKCMYRNHVTIISFLLFCNCLDGSRWNYGPSDKMWHWMDSS